MFLLPNTTCAIACHPLQFRMHAPSFSVNFCRSFFFFLIHVTGEYGQERCCGHDASELLVLNSYICGRDVAQTDWKSFVQNGFARQLNHSIFCRRFLWNKTNRPIHLSRDRLVVWTEPLPTRRRCSDITVLWEPRLPMTRPHTDRDDRKRYC